MGVAPVLTTKNRKYIGFMFLSQTKQTKNLVGGISTPLKKYESKLGKHLPPIFGGEN